MYKIHRGSFVVYHFLFFLHVILGRRVCVISFLRAVCAPGGAGGGFVFPMREDVSGAVLSGCRGFGR